MSLDNSRPDKEAHFNRYNSLIDLSESQRNQLKDLFSRVLIDIKSISLTKVISLLRYLPVLCRLHYISYENRKRKNIHPEKHHPVQPIRGEIYNTLITENIGSEINGNHLAIVISNAKTNIFADKINIVPIEGDGNKITTYLVQLRNEDLEDGHLDKDPSRIIIPEILTVDKARLQNRIGKIKEEKMKIINDKLKRQLDL